MDYISSIEKIIEYIEENIKEKLDCDTVIEQSFYSRTQFYRIFGAMADMSLSDYIRKRKLSCAAIDLYTTSKRLIDIACDYGYESQEVFTRAFQREFGITPGKVRKQHVELTLFERLNLRRKIMNEVSRLKDYSAVPLVTGTMQFAGLKANVTPESTAISELWSEFTQQLKMSEGLDAELVYGICDFAPDASDDDVFGYFCAATITDASKVPSNMLTFSIEPCTYIKVRHDRELRSLKETYKLFYGVWLPISNYQLIPRNTIEVYNRINGGMEIWIPVKECK